MDLATGLYLAAGLGALALGGGTLLREPGRRRNWFFALFCAALACWNLGKVGELSGVAPGFRWRVVFLLGACLAAPLGLHFCLLITGRLGPRLRLLLPLAYGAATLLWLSSWNDLYEAQPAWNLTALAVLGAILSGGVVALRRHYASLPRGPRRTAARLILGGGAIGAAGGISDFIPRDFSQFPKVGPVALLLFLLVVCAVLVRYRFLDVDVFLARALASLAGAAAASVVLYYVVRFSGVRILPLFAATLAIIAVAGPVWRGLLYGARNLFGPGDPLAQALMAMSQRLSLARDAAEVRAALEESRQALTADVRIDIYVEQDPGGHFRPAFPARAVASSPAVPRDSALPRLLERERAPLTRHFLEVEAQETWGDRRRLAALALEQLDALELDLAAPLLGGERLAGWIGVRGQRPESYLTAEVAAALLAVGNQALASLERVEAVEAAKRREALAAVGEMAAGLAHEVRNPLGAIRGAVQVLGGEKGARQEKEMLEVIQEETERLGRVVGEFLDYARPASPRREPVDLGDLARRVLRAAETAGTMLRSEVRVHEGTPPALADSDQLRRAFGNLVQNSRDAAGPDGFLRIEVGPESGGRVAARFEDSGPGIPHEQVARLFQPFFTTKHGGTGLGLALVHRVVEAHGGEVRVEGRPGSGAVFTVVLPAAKAGT